MPRQASICAGVKMPGAHSQAFDWATTLVASAMISPAEAARRMLRGWSAGRFEIHFPRRFTWPMKLLSLLPFGVYQALVRRGTGV